MNIKTITVSLIMVTSLFIHTACNDSKTVDTTKNTPDSTINSSNNITSTSITPTSLILNIDKALLTKDENTTVNVIATYSDGTSKDVTNAVAWVVSPNSEAVEITNSTLKAVKDLSTTIKAKINSVTSNTVTLNISWIVNGHELPPESDKASNDATLLGVDVNGNDVRDDVERWIYETYKDKHPIYIDIAMQAGRGYKKVLESPEKAKEIRGIVNGSMNCGLYYQYNAKYLNEPILVNERIDTKIFSQIFNTKERSNVYWQYDKLLSGGVYNALRSAELKAQCDFNTSQYQE